VEVTDTVPAVRSPVPGARPEEAPGPRARHPAPPRRRRGQADARLAQRLLRAVALREEPRPSRPRLHLLAHGRRVAGWCSRA